MIPTCCIPEHQADSLHPPRSLYQRRTMGNQIECARALPSSSFHGTFFARASLRCMGLPKQTKIIQSLQTLPIRACLGLPKCALTFGTITEDRNVPISVFDI